MKSKQKKFPQKKSLQAQPLKKTPYDISFKNQIKLISSPKEKHYVIFISYLFLLFQLFY